MKKITKLSLILGIVRIAFSKTSRIIIYEDNHFKAKIYRGYIRYRNKELECMFNYKIYVLNSWYRYKRIISKLINGNYYYSIVKLRG